MVVTVNICNAVKFAVVGVVGVCVCVCVCDLMQSISLALHVLTFCLLASNTAIKKPYLAASVV